MEVVRVSGLEPDQSELFEAWAQVFIDAALADNGESDERSATDLREMERNPDVGRRLMAVLDEGRVVAGASVMFPLQDNLTHSFATIAVLPEFRRRGLGTRLLDWIEEQAREQGRATLQMHFNARPGARPAGFAFAEQCGFSLEQRLVRNDLDLSSWTGADANVPVPEGYRLVAEVGLPPERQADYARFQEAITTDIPLGGLALEPEVWDVERVGALSARLEAMGRTRWLVWAEHEGSGECAGFTEVQWAPELGPIAYQQDTLVHRDHRGHGLGMALKRVNAAQIAAGQPAIATIRTWNADDNTHMLAVNAALGYVVGSQMLEWQKLLRPAG